MRACWHATPELRPSFPEISLILKDPYLLSSITEEEYYYPDPPTDIGQSTTSSATTIPATRYRRPSRDSTASGSPNGGASYAVFGADGRRHRDGDDSGDEDDDELKRLLPSSLEDEQKRSL